MGKGNGTSGTRAALPKPYYERDGITIYCADAREILPNLEPASADFIFTDPPYGHNNNNGDLIHRWEAALGRLPSGADHPTPKPLALALHFVRLHTKPGDTIIDPFCGHGPTLEAAKLSGCKAIGIDVREEYCEATAHRLNQGVLPFAAGKEGGGEC